MALPLISIVTPSYNQVDYLEETLRSVLDQGYPNLEYLVVDGGSTDSSADLIRRYAGRLAWWVSERDRGQADAVNKGFARAHGEIVGWLNSDDRYLPGAFEGAVAAFREHPEAAVVYSDVRSIGADGRAFNVMRYGQWGLDELMTFHIIGQPGAFIRRSALEQAGYLDPDCHYLLDHQLWLRLAQVGPMVHVNAIWAEARFHAAAKNVSQTPQYGKDAYALVAWMRAQPGLAGHYRRLERQIWAGAHRINARYLLDGGFARESLSAYWQSLRAYPPVALPEAHRMLYAALSLAGLAWLKPIYLGVRRRLKRI